MKYTKETFTIAAHKNLLHLPKSVKKKCKTQSLTI